MKIADIDPRGRTEEKLFYDLRQGEVYRRGVLEVLLSCGVLPGTEKSVRNENL